MPVVAAASYAPWLTLLAATAGLVGLVSVLLVGVCCCFRSRSKDNDSDIDGDTTDEESARPALIRKKDSLRGEQSRRGVEEEEEEEEEEEGEEHVYEDVEQGKKKKHKTWFTRRDSKQKELSQQDLASLTVKERISQLEAGRQDDGKVSKPKKKRPNHQAFQEFERSGMLISFGQVPKRHPDEEMEHEEVVGEHEDEEDFSLQMNQEVLASHQETALMQQTVKQEDLAAVTRETELLKSFRKPPPPKNRGRAKRSGHSQAHSDNLQSPTRGLESPLETEEETMSSIKTSPSRDMTDFSSTDSGIDNTQSSCSHSLPDFLSKHDDMGPLNKTRSVEDCGGGSDAEEEAAPRRLSGMLSDSRNLLCAPQVSARLVKDFMQDDNEEESTKFNVISIHLNPLSSEGGGLTDSSSPVSISRSSPKSLVNRGEDERGGSRVLSKSAPNGNTEDLIKKFSHLSHSPPDRVTYDPDTNSVLHGKTRRKSHEESLRLSESHRNRSRYQHQTSSRGRVHDAMVRFNVKQEPTHV